MTTIRSSHSVQPHKVTPSGDISGQGQTDIKSHHHHHHDHNVDPLSRYPYPYMDTTNLSHDHTVNSGLEDYVTHSTEDSDSELDYNTSTDICMVHIHTLHELEDIFDDDDLSRH